MGCRWVVQRFLPLPFFLLLVELLAPPPLAAAPLVEGPAPALLEEAGLSAEEPTGGALRVLVSLPIRGEALCEQ